MTEDDLELLAWAMQPLLSNRSNRNSEIRGDFNSKMNDSSTTESHINLRKKSKTSICKDFKMLKYSHVVGLHSLLYLETFKSFSSISPKVCFEMLSRKTFQSNVVLSSLCTPSQTCSQTPYPAQKQVKSKRKIACRPCMSIYGSTLSNDIVERLHWVLI